MQTKPAGERRPRARPEAPAGASITVLHTAVWPEALGLLGARAKDLDLPVDLAPLGSRPGEVLLVPGSLSDDEFLRARDAGVRWVQALTIGLENVLPLALVESPVEVTSVRGLAAQPIAEFVFARILGHAKRIREMDEAQRVHAWPHLTLRSVAGSTLVVVGLGPLGSAIAELGRCFRMHVVGVRRRPDAGAGPCDEVVSTADLPTVLARGDYVVLAAPLTAETKGMLGPRELRAMKEGSFLVNVGRAGLVEERALSDVLTEGYIEATSDVFASEPLPEGSPWWDMPGFAISPHCAGRTPQVFQEMVEIVVDNIGRFLRGEPLRNMVDKYAGYPRPE